MGKEQGANVPEAEEEVAPLTIAERRHLAFQLRKQGGSYSQIATQLAQRPDVSDKYSRMQAFRDITAELERINRESAVEVRAYQRLQTERLEDLWAIYYPLALRRDFAALDRCLAIHDRLVRLHGLDRIPANTPPPGAEGADRPDAADGPTLEEWRAKRRAEAAATMAIFSNPLVAEDAPTGESSD